MPAQGRKYILGGRDIMKIENKMPVEPENTAQQPFVPTLVDNHVALALLNYFKLPPQ